MSHLSTTMAPMHKLLAKEQSGTGKTVATGFEAIKLQLVLCKLLMHYDPDVQLVLSCDASPSGVGAVLAHCFDDSAEWSTAFVSHTLVPAECWYSQLDKETLAIILSLQKFHQYLFKRTFVIYIQRS